MALDVLKNVPADALASEDNVARDVAQSIRVIGANTNEAFETVNRTLTEHRDLLKKIEERGGSIKAEDVEKANRLATDLSIRLEEAQKENDKIKARMDELDAAIQRSLSAAPQTTDEPQLRDAAFSFMRQRMAAKRGKQDMLNLRMSDMKDEDVALYKEYRNAFNMSLRYNEERLNVVLSDTEKRALYEGSDPDGGYWILPERANEILTKIHESSPMRELATVSTISGKSLEIPKYPNQFSSGWSSETAPVTATSTGQVGSYEIIAHGVYAYPEATRELLEDAAFNVEQWIVDESSADISREEAAAFISGNGIGKPRGILDYTLSATASSWDGDLTLRRVPLGSTTQIAYTASNASQGLVAVQAALKEAYHANATWLCKRTTIANIMSIADGDSSYMFATSLVLRDGGGFMMQLMGYPIRFADDMPAMGSGNNVLAFGDYRRGYRIVDRTGISVERFREKNPPFVGFYVRKRVGGAVVDPDAIIIANMATS